ncbi:Xaa-Pro dipeptidyl-peptidase [Nocardiopsis trehalosi]|jgi:X-Pro dipeptidyl-peptidase|uniref:Xaa-Pro dipeptidyl-peptidase n=1 Tax=Nocardiopsis trehalosi TaxID=109329 RepID=UPI000832BF81|nr:Xaa-Pro dipeptidyl-peptidase [Nocardiopsis trehalosi]
MRIPHRAAGRTGSVALAAAVAAALLAAPAAADTPALRIEDGATQVAFDYADAVYSEVDVRTEADSDGDGTADTVRLRIMRPRETAEGLKVATILEPSPYWAGINDVPMHEVDVDDDGAGTVPRGGPGRGTALAATAADPMAARGGPAAEGTLSGYYDNYFLPRGYAVAQLDSVGSGAATGCPTTGGENETLGVKAAVDWLNGRTTGWTPDGEEVSATDWSTGDVAMTGISYNGTLPVAAATTGVEGLRTIVPQGAISSWYEYYRDNGGVVAPGGYQGEDADVLAEAVYTRADQDVCDPVIADVAADQARETGDYTRFWADRNYRDDVDRFTASVLLAHGLNDWNVKTDQATRLWEKLAEHDVPRRLWLHQGGHVDPFNLEMDAWLGQLHAWFDHWLYGVDNGVMDAPPVAVENADSTWRHQDAWPASGTDTVRLRPGRGHRDGTTALGAGPGRGGTRTFTDAGRTVPADDLATDPDLAGRNALVHTTGELTEDVRLNGTAEVTVRAAMDGASPYLTALLVDFGTATRPTGGVVYDRDNPVCYGEGVPGDTGCTYPAEHATETADHRIVSRAWLDARNRTSETRQRPVVADRMYRYTWEFQAQDYTFPKGHRIGLVLISTDHEYTVRYPAGTEVTVDQSATALDLPVADGRAALGG